jgi:hypothetical protein
VSNSCVSTVISFERTPRTNLFARLDLRTSRKEPWKEIRSPDPAGVSTVEFVCLTPDGQSYVYAYPRLLSTLYVSEGLR